MMKYLLAVALLVVFAPCAPAHGAAEMWYTVHKVGAQYPVMMVTDTKHQCEAFTVYTQMPCVKGTTAMLRNGYALAQGGEVAVFLQSKDARAAYTTCHQLADIENLMPGNRYRCVGVRFA